MSARKYLPSIQPCSGLQGTNTCFMCYVWEPNKQAMAVNGFYYIAELPTKVTKYYSSSAADLNMDAIYHGRRVFIDSADAETSSGSFRISLSAAGRIQ